MRALLTAIVLIIMNVLPSLAADVLIVQSSSAPAYGEALRGFREVYKGTSQTIVLSDYAEVDVVRLVNEERPKLVVAVGEQALAACRKVRRLPVVALMALSLNVQKKPAGNVGGVTAVAAPQQYLELFKKLGARRIGVLFDPSRTGYYLRRAEQAAKSMGLQLVSLSIESPREVAARLEQLKGKADALWMLPDATAVTAGNQDAYFLFAMEQKIPLVAFGELYLQKGAAASLDVSRSDMGRQAGELAVSLLNGSVAAVDRADDPRKVVLNTNDSVLSNLGIFSPGLRKTGSNTAIPSR